MDIERSPSRRSRPSTMHKVSIRRRKQATAAAEFCTLISLVTTALVLLGNTHLNSATDSIYFLKLDTSSPYPTGAQDSQESIMRYITEIRGAKLAHFYQVGLWNYCEGYEDKGITYCSKPAVTHYFNPVEMMISRALPAKYGKPQPKGMSQALHTAQNASKAMFACYFLGGAFLLISLILDWISILFSRNYILTSVFSLIGALFTFAAACVSTYLFIRFWAWLDGTPGLAIRSQLGSTMYTCVWCAAIFGGVAFAFHVRVALLPASGKPGWKMAVRADKKVAEEWY